MGMYGPGLNPFWDVNRIVDVYPEYPQVATGIAAGQLGAPGPGRGTSGVPAMNPQAAKITGRNWLMAGAGFVVLWFLLTWAAKKSGNESEFSNIKASFYNVLVIGLAALIFLAPAKVLANRFKIPGVSSWILTA